MKKINIIFVVVMITVIILSGCKSKQGISSNDKANNEQSVDETEAIKQTDLNQSQEHIRTDGWLEGTVQGRTVYMKLQPVDNKIEGTYYYDDDKIKITLKGEILNQVFSVDSDTSIDESNAMRLEGIILSDNLIEGIWNQGKESYPVYFAKQGTSTDVVTKPSPELEKWRGNWSGEKSTLHAGSDITITPIFDNLIRFEISAFSGTHSGGFTSIATVKDGKAIYRGEDNVTFHFSYSDGKINLETKDYTYYCGAGVTYDASYVQGPVKKDKPTAKALGICYTEEQEAAFKELVGPYYDQFIEYTQHYTEVEDQDNLGMDVRIFGMRGYSNTAIVMIDQDKNEFMAGLDGEKGIYYFSNVDENQLGRVPPKTIKEWAGDRQIINKESIKIEKKISKDIAFDFYFDIDWFDNYIKNLTINKIEKGIEKRIFTLDSIPVDEEMIISKDKSLAESITVEDKDGDGIEEIELLLSDFLGYPYYIVIMNVHETYQIAFKGLDFDKLEYVDVNKDGVIEIVNEHGGGGGYVSSWTGLDLVNERRDNTYHFSYDLTAKYYHHKKNEALATFKKSSTPENFINLLNLCADLGLVEACDSLIHENDDLVKDKSFDYSKYYDAPADTFFDYIPVRAYAYQSTWKELKKLETTSVLDDKTIPKEIVQFMSKKDMEHDIAYYEEVDMDGDGQVEIVVATGLLDEDPYNSYLYHIYILRLKDGNIEQISDNLAQGGYGVYSIKTVQLQGFPNNNYLYCKISNGVSLGGFDLYGLKEGDVQKVAYSASATGSGLDQLVDNNEDGLYDGYVQSRSSYDVLYYDVAYFHTLEGEHFMLSKMSINLPPYPDTIEEVLVQYLSLRLLDIGQSPELSERLNELCTDQQAKDIDIPYNVLYPALLNAKLKLDPAIQIHIDEETGDATATCEATESKTLTYRFHVIKEEGKWQIDSISYDITGGAYNDSF